MFLPVMVGIISATASYFWARDVLLIIFLLLASTVFAVLSRSGGPRRDALFMTLIMVTSVGLLMSSTSISDNLHGWDIHEEFAIFTEVSRNGVWRGELNPTGSPLHNLYTSTLSISILPIILSLISGLDGFRVFMFVFPLVFSVAPLILYVINRKILPPEGAFLSVFLFVSYPAFYLDLIQLAREAIAEIMLLLLLWLLLSPKLMQRRSTLAAIMLLTIGIAISHYSLAFLYVALLAFSFALSRISRRVAALPSLNVFLLAGVVVFSWYLLVAGGSAINVVSEFTSYVIQGLLRDFFNPGSRPSVVNQALGLAYVTPGLLHDLNRFTQYFVQFAMLLGFGFLALKKKKNTTERTVALLMVFGFLLLGGVIILPRFGAGLEFSRFYHISLILLSSCFAIGTQMVISFGQGLIHKLGFHATRLSLPVSSPRLLGATILFSYLLFTSGWVWAVSMDSPISLILDRDRMLNDPSSQRSYYSELTVSQDVAAARWLGSRVASGRSVCADYISRSHVLTSYGGFSSNQPELPSECEFYSYIYLSVLNTRYGIGAGERNRWDISEISPELIAKNRICSNGGAVIYVSP
jgi:uncharacterized membrane protein